MENGEPEGRLAARCCEWNPESELGSNRHVTPMIKSRTTGEHNVHR